MYIWGQLSVQTTEIIKFDQIHIEHILLLKIKVRTKVRIFVCIVLLFQEFKNNKEYEKLFYCNLYTYYVNCIFLRCSPSTS